MSRVRNPQTRETPTRGGGGGVTGSPSVPRETTGPTKRWSKPGYGRATRAPGAEEGKLVVAGGRAPIGARRDYTLMPSSFAAVPPSIAMRSSSVRLGVARMWSTEVFVHGNG